MQSNEFVWSGLGDVYLRFPLAVVVLVLCHSSWIFLHRFFIYCSKSVTGAVTVSCSGNIQTAYDGGNPRKILQILLFYALFSVYG